MVLDAQGKETETQEQTFPQIGIHVSANGLLISIALGSGLSIQQTLPAQVVQQIFQQWQGIQEQRIQDMQLMGKVLQTKQ